MVLTIFYDSYCPLCQQEIKQLKSYDTEHLLSFQDIHDVEFIHRYPHIDKLEANRILHGQLSNGEMLYGLDVTCLAWKTVGKHRWLAILRWPVIRTISDLAYLFFARHRNSIACVLMPDNKSLTTSKSCVNCKIPD